LKSEEYYKKLEEEYYNYYLDRVLPPGAELEELPLKLLKQEARRRAVADIRELRHQDTVQAIEQEELEALQAKLENSTESVDVSGGKEKNMHRVPYTLPNGEIREVTASTLRELAQKVCNQTSAYFEAGAAPKQQAPAQDRGPTFREWAETLRKKEALEAFKRHEDNSYLKKYILPYFGDKYVKEIVRSDCTAFINKLAADKSEKTGKSLAQKTARSIKSLVSSILKQACYDGLISNNPMENIRIKNRQGEPKNKAVAGDNISNWLSMIPRIKEENVRLYAAISISTSLRPGEICALRWSDYHTGDGQPYFEINSSVKWANLPTGQKGPMIKDPKTKNGNRQVFIMWGGAVDILNTAQQADGYIIRGTKTNKDGQKPISLHQLTTINNCLKSYSKRAGLQRPVLGYDGRHTAATALNYVNASDTSIEKLMGHSSAEFTRAVYVDDNWGKAEKDAKTVSALYDRISQTAVGAKTQ